MNRDRGLAAQRSAIAGERTALAVVAGAVADVRLRTTPVSYVQLGLLVTAAGCALCALALCIRRRRTGPVGDGLLTATLALSIVALGVAELAP